MTDEAPTAAEVQALIARLNDPAASRVYGEAGGRTCREAAAALAAQAQRIASWEQVWDGVRVHVPDLRENNKPLAVAASYELLWIRAEKAEAALAQAVPREPTEAMIDAWHRADQQYQNLRFSEYVPAIWRAMYDAAPAAPRGKP